MKKGEVSLLDMDYEYKLWTNRLKCYIHEIQIIKERNIEVANARPGEEQNDVEMMVLEEHESQLVQLVNRIKVQGLKLQGCQDEFPVNHEHEYMVEHQKIRGKVSRLCTIHLEKVDDLINALGI